MENLEKLASVFKALSDPTRLKIVKLLCQRKQPICVNGLTNHLDISQSAVSQHLKVLKQADLVKGERRGNFIHYELNVEDLDAFRKQLLETQGEDFLVFSNNGNFSFGTSFWDKKYNIKVLEEHLSKLQNKTSEIESMIRMLKEEKS